MTARAFTPEGGAVAGRVRWPGALACWPRASRRPRPPGGGGAGGPHRRRGAVRAHHLRRARVQRPAHVQRDPERLRHARGARARHAAASSPRRVVPAARRPDVAVQAPPRRPVHQRRAVRRRGREVERRADARPGDQVEEHRAGERDRARRRGGRSDGQHQDEDALSDPRRPARQGRAHAAAAVRAGEGRRLHRRQPRRHRPVPRGPVGEGRRARAGGQRAGISGARPGSRRSSSSRSPRPPRAPTPSPTARWTSPATSHRNLVPGIGAGGKAEVAQGAEPRGDVLRPSTAPWRPRPEEGAPGDQLRGERRRHHQGRDGGRRRAPGGHPGQGGVWLRSDGQALPVRSGAGPAAPPRGELSGRLRVRRQRPHRALPEREGDRRGYRW